MTMNYVRWLITFGILILVYYGVPLGVIGMLFYLFPGTSVSATVPTDYGLQEVFIYTVLLVAAGAIVFNLWRLVRKVWA